ncbi:MAG: monovalent cation/H+ antiporter subunit D family protein, partial [Gammaproteobacteria bacterium]|nr:monovalent cation/H+ antiporter subunit D family protein [Gammaproteobacteria bacterium]
MPALAVVLPLLSAPLCLFISRPLLAWLFTMLASGLTMLVSIALLQQVMASGTIVYEMGGWSAPWGIEYRVDRLNAYLLLIVSSISTVVLLAARISIE